MLRARPPSIDTEYYAHAGSYAAAAGTHAAYADSGSYGRPSSAGSGASSPSLRPLQLPIARRHKRAARRAASVARRPRLDVRPLSCAPHCTARSGQRRGGGPHRLWPACASPPRPVVRVRSRRTCRRASPTLGRRGGSRETGADSCDPHHVFQHGMGQVMMDESFLESWLRSNACPDPGIAVSSAARGPRAEQAGRGGAGRGGAGRGGERARAR